MNSPELQLLRNFIRLNRTDSTPIYLQIAQGIINCIHTKSLKTGNKLPGSRTLSESLFVHRNTVVAAYEELAAQGWIEIIAKKGAFVTAKKIKSTLQNPIQANSQAIQAVFTLEKNIILEMPDSAVSTEYFFTHGTADHRLFPTKEINQIMASLAIKKSTQKLMNSDFYQENENLKNQLINYIHVTKSIAVTTKQILATNNNTTALHTIIQSLLQPNDKVIIVEPGNYTVHMKLKQAGIDIIPIGLNEKGLDFKKLEQHLQTQSIRAIYIQTNHLYPTVNALENEAKDDLLNLANQYKCILIEDDNNTDYVFSKHAQHTLKKLDKYGCVVYINSLQHLMPSPYNIGYIVAPDNVISEMTKVKNHLQNSSNYLVEETVAEYIKEGLLLRQIHRNTKFYLKRRGYFQQILLNNLDQNIAFELPNTGLAFWITFSNKLPLLAIANSCRAQNLTIPTHLLYQNQHLTGMRIGFGHMNETEAEQTITILSNAIYRHLYN